ncbi:Uncharacterized protein APZ42_026653 [Daphnia magna]|uniref:Uncharacterized protein n=1 Tax=Daphnia magna TaxID=35525 RepID=A0A164S265_9CRUS|nr:Uncharacterized protein APZ42_026653 [Daphnia magna]
MTVMRTNNFLTSVQQQSYRASWKCLCFPSLPSWQHVTTAWPCVKVNGGT